MSRQRRIRSRLAGTTVMFMTFLALANCRFYRDGLVLGPSYLVLSPSLGPWSWSTAARQPSGPRTKDDGRTKNKGQSTKDHPKSARLCDTRARPAGRYTGRTSAARTEPAARCPD